MSQGMMLTKRATFMALVEAAVREADRAILRLARVLFPTWQDARRIGASTGKPKVGSPQMTALAAAKGAKE